MLNEPENPGNADDEARAREVAELAEEIDEVERDAARRIEPGRRGFVISIMVFLVIIAQLLPWVGDSAGWQVLIYGDDGAIPRLFAATSAGFGIGASALTLITRRWWLSWVCAVGSCIAVVDGVLAIWSLQSSPVSGEQGAGPGPGMIAAVVLMLVLAVNWLRLAWSRMDQT